MIMFPKAHLINCQTESQYKHPFQSQCLTTLSVSMPGALNRENTVHVYNIIDILRALRHESIVSGKKLGQLNWNQGYEYNSPKHICMIQYQGTRWNCGFVAGTFRGHFANGLWDHKSRENSLALILIWMIQSGHNLAHGATAQLSCHVQNCDLIESLFFMKMQGIFLQDFRVWAYKPFVSYCVAGNNGMCGM